MGQLSSTIRGKVVAVDSALLIYYLEDHPDYSPVADEISETIRQKNASALTSVVSLLEVLVLPLRRGRKDLADQYRRFLLHTRGVSIVSVDEQVCEIAARLRAKYAWLRTPDAVQVATALAQGAEVIVTNDEHWRQFTELPVLILKDYVVRKP